jgi:hypothetical protein
MNLCQLFVLNTAGGWDDSNNNLPNSGIGYRDSDIRGVGQRAARDGIKEENKNGV